ncbi:type ISP restriction/modification enzyme [uncultured Helicobacter sp.]|uniref:type ISP restriction/modification enzyme n=1 Tax=uncultured Helicobacter sp. TaxID=175537 RepID=UPI00343A8BAC
MIITGNPPYSGASANKGLFEDNVRITYGLEPSEAHLNKVEQGLIQNYLKNKNSTKEFKNILERKKLKNEKNPKWLLDDYVKFICFAESKIKEQPSGIFAFISNNSFLDNPTFRGMRYHLLKTFDTIYILDLHGNARKKECTPDGSKDENVFDIMQGVSINIFVKNRNSSLTQDTRISRSQHSEDSNEKPQKLAQIHHYDLYGKRSDKTNFLYENTLDSIAWATLQPKAPFYLFIPQNESLRAEYEKGFSIKDIFKVSSVGVVTGKDSVLIASNEKQLEQQVKDFYNEFDLKFVKNIAYRPFDLMKVYYDTSKVTRPRFEVMQHFLQNDNVGLIYKRGFPNTQSGQGFATDSIIDFRSWSCSGMQGGDYISPLYLKNTESSKDKSPKKNKKDSQENADSKQGQWVENFTPEFRNFIDTKYNEHFSPEQILGYIYAVLFHKDYREKYIDFLKIDFPKIPFVESKKKFLEFSALGWELINTHLLQSDTLDSVIGEAKYKDTKNKNLKIEKIIYEPKEQKLFVNENLHFCGVNEAVWDYKIGGYQVLDKYLKSHKGEKIDHAHFSRVIQTLHRSLEIESQIAKVKL